MSGAYYNRRMDTTTIYNYGALNYHINSSEIVEVCHGKLRIGSLETGLLALELDESSGNYRFPFEYVRKLNKFLGQRRSTVRVESGVPFRSSNPPGLTPLCLTAREEYHTTFLVTSKTYNITTERVYRCDSHVVSWDKSHLPPTNYHDFSSLPTL